MSEHLAGDWLQFITDGTTYVRVDGIREVIDYGRSVGILTDIGRRVRLDITLEQFQAAMERSRRPKGVS